METLLKKSTLSNHCKADLERLLQQFRQESMAVSSGPVTYDHSQLPKCVNQLTASKAARTKRPATHSVPPSWRGDGTGLGKSEKKLLQSVDDKLKATPAPSNGFIKKRHLALPLTAKEQDFVYRYAEHKHGAQVRHGQETHEQSMAYRAYTEAFLGYTGREPSQLELQEVDRLHFLQSNGRVGVMQNPHAPTPHHHISLHNSKVCSCNEQVYLPEKSIVKAARPGSTVLSRMMLTQSSGAGSVGTLSPTRSSKGGLSPIRAVPCPPADATSRKCAQCGNGLPPRLIKSVCPACDKS